LERAAKFRIYSTPFAIHNGFDQDFEHHIEMPPKRKVVSLEKLDNFYIRGF
jgi:hypothetical protein